MSAASIEAAIRDLDAARLQQDMEAFGKPIAPGEAEKIVNTPRLPLYIPVDRIFASFSAGLHRLPNLLRR